MSYSELRLQELGDDVILFLWLSMHIQCKDNPDIMNHRVDMYFIRH